MSKVTLILLTLFISLQTRSMWPCTSLTTFCDVWLGTIRTEKRIRIFPGIIPETAEPGRLVIAALCLKDKSDVLCGSEHFRLFGRSSGTGSMQWTDKAGNRHRCINTRDFSPLWRRARAPRSLDLQNYKYMNWHAEFTVNFKDSMFNLLCSRVSHQAERTEEQSTQPELT